MPDERRKTQDKTPGLSHNVSRRIYLYTTPSGLVQGPASDWLTNRITQAEGQPQPEQSAPGHRAHGLEPRRSHARGDPGVSPSRLLGTEKLANRSLDSSNSGR